jgi:hypothetical protein
MGFASADDRIHAPNERFPIATFFRGIETSIWFMALAARKLAITPSTVIASEWVTA